MSFNVGEMVGPYRVIEQLGQGGMATVYKAYHAALDRYVALKVLHPALLEDPSFPKRFQREARLVARLDHPNIVPIFDYAEHDGRPYLVMKFIEGETLKARLARGPLDSEEIAEVVDTVGAALAYAHEHSILHRDIKPSNVLLATNGQIYLADFGLARIAQNGESTLTSDMILGTPQYISPEQALGKKDLDEGTDIYSFGVMLYELIVGKVPFSADTPFSVIHDHIYTPLPMPQIINPNVSEAIERVLLKALAKERRDRFEDVPALVEAFKNAWQEPAVFGAQVIAASSVPEATMAVTDDELIIPPPPEVELAPVADSGETPIPAPATSLTADDKPIIPAPPEAEPAPVAAPAEMPAPTPAEKAIYKQGKLRIKTHLEHPERKGGRGCFWLPSRIILVVLVCLGAYWIFSTFGRQIGEAVPPLRPFVAKYAPFQTPQTLIDIAQAERQARTSQNDPKAYLRLALVYAKAGLADPANEAISNLEKLTPNAAFYWDAGTQLMNAKAWLPAARLLVDAAEKSPKAGAGLAAEKRDLLHHAVYKAFEDANAGDYITIERLAGLDKPLSELADARHWFYQDDEVEAQKMLEQLRQEEPDMPEILLLQAEMDVKFNRPDLARAQLAQLRKNSSASIWMLDEAKTIEGTIK